MFSSLIFSVKRKYNFERVKYNDYFVLFPIFTFAIASRENSTRRAITARTKRSSNNSRSSMALLLLCFFLSGPLPLPLPLPLPASRAVRPVGSAPPLVPFSGRLYLRTSAGLSRVSSLKVSWDRVKPAKRENRIFPKKIKSNYVWLSIFKFRHLVLHVQCCYAVRTFEWVVTVKYLSSRKQHVCDTGSH